MTARTMLLAAVASLAGTAGWAQAIPFGEVDLNGDGLLERHELVAAFGSSGEQVLDRDVDGDGAVSADEIAEDGDDGEPRPATHPMNKALSFEVVDLDGDGLLSHKEMVTTFGRNGVGLMRKDANGDGYISKEEVRSGGSASRSNDEAMATKAARETDTPARAGKSRGADERGGGRSDNRGGDRGKSGESKGNGRDRG